MILKHFQLLKSKKKLFYQYTILNMLKESIGQEFRLKSREEIKEIDR